MFGTNAGNFEKPTRRVKEKSVKNSYPTGRDE